MRFLNATGISKNATLKTPTKSAPTCLDVLRLSIPIDKLGIIYYNTITKRKGENKMMYWQKYDNKRFDTREEAYEDFLENETINELEDYLLEEVGLDARTLLRWIMNQDSFWEAFQDEITKAREMMFEDSYCYWEDGE